MPVSDDVKRGALICALASAALVLAFSQAKTNPNAASRHATIEALVHNGTFVIDDAVFNKKTIDKVKLGDNFLSSKPPVLSTLLAGAYWVYHHLTGVSFRVRDGTSAIYFTSLMSGLLPHLILLLYFWRFLGLWVQSAQARTWAFASIALGYIGMGYSGGVNNHSVAAAVLFVSFYHAYRLRHGHSSEPWRYAVAGLLAGLAPTLDLPNLFFSVAITVYLFTHKPKETLLYFGAGAIPPLALHFYLTYISTGSLYPIYLRKELYLYPGSYWLKPRGMDALDEPKYVYLFHMLLGHHGYFAMTPTLIFAAVALLQAVRRRTSDWREALVAGVPFLILVPFYAAKTNNYGGSCAGFRWLIIAMPMMFIFTARWLDTERPRLLRALFAVAFFIASFNAVDTLRAPWGISQWQVLCRRIGIDSSHLPQKKVMPAPAPPAAPPKI